MNLGVTQTSGYATLNEVPLSHLDNQEYSMVVVVDHSLVSQIFHLFFIHLILYPSVIVHLRIVWRHLLLEVKKINNHN